MLIHKMLIHNYSFQNLLQMNGKLDKIMNHLIIVHFYLVKYLLKLLKISYKHALQENGILLKFIQFLDVR